jgi:nucleotide-binding universal stress UspA family protein
MNTKKILVPTDFSDFTNAALRYASSLAAESGAKLYIVHVNDLLSTSVAMGEPAFVESALWLESSREEAHRQLEEVKPTLPNVDFERHDLEGDPVHEIVTFAEREHVDLIVVGSHGRSGLVRLVMGSVAEGIARKATCPVLIVKQPAPTSDAALNAGSNETVAYNPSDSTALPAGSSTSG